MLTLLDQAPHFENHCSRPTVNYYYYYLSSTYPISSTLVSKTLHIIMSFIPIIAHIIWSFKETICCFYNAILILDVLDFTSCLEHVPSESRANNFFHSSSGLPSPTLHLSHSNNYDLLSTCYVPKTLHQVLCLVYYTFYSPTTTSWERYNYFHLTDNVTKFREVNLLVPYHQQVPILGF